MQMFRAMEASSSALTAERLRMDLVANNLANLNTTRTDGGGPYRRRFAVQAERRETFHDALLREQEKLGPASGAGVRVTGVTEDPSEFRLKHDPAHPDADENGYVRLPNVDMLTEITDMMMASRAYEANITAFNAAKGMAQKALEIGR